MGGRVLKRGGGEGKEKGEKDEGKERERKGLKGSRKEKERLRNVIP